MSETRRSYPDPVSSISFAELLGVFFKGLLQALRDLILFLSRNKILIICFLAIGILMGVVKYKTSPSYYKVAMMVRHTELTSQTYGQMIRSLNDLVESGSSQTLAHALVLENPMAEQIRSISARELDGKDLLKDTSSLADRTFIIEMTVRNAGIADTVENALLKYFNDNPFINKLKQDQIQVYSTRLQLMDGEMRRIDSLTEAYTRGLSASKGASNFYNNAFNSADLLKEFSKFVGDRQDVEGWLLGKRESLQLIDGVKPTVTPASASLVPTIILYAVLFFFAGCLVGGMLEISQNLKK